MLIDCQSCPGRSRLCGDCALAPLLLAPTTGLPLDPAEADAVTTFASMGLISTAEAMTVRARHEPTAARAAG